MKRIEIVKVSNGYIVHLPEKKLEDAAVFKHIEHASQYIIEYYAEAALKGIYNTAKGDEYEQQREEKI